MSSIALDQLKRQIGKLSKSSGTNLTNAIDSTGPNTDLYYENVDYCEENVEYVIYDSTAEIIEEAEIIDKSHEILETDGIDSDVTEYQKPANLPNEHEVCLQITNHHFSSLMTMIDIFILACITKNHLKKENIAFTEEGETD